MTGSGSRKLVISGTVAEVNADLRSIAYVGTATGSDTIHIATADSGGGHDVATIGVTVNAPSSASFLSLVQQMGAFGGIDQRLG